MEEQKALLETMKHGLLMVRESANQLHVSTREDCARLVICYDTCNELLTAVDRLSGMIDHEQVR